MQQLIALKLGSSNTSIYKQGEGIVLFEPSLVAYSKVGNQREVKAIGTRAKRMLGRTDEATYVDSPIFEGKITDTELCEVMLKFFMQKIFPKRFIKPQIKAIVCLPLGLNVHEKKAFERVCFNVGIQDVVFVPSIICGALGYNLPIENTSGTLFVNIGGGSTDIAVICMNNILAGVNIGVGGETMDKAVEQHILNTHNLLIGKGASEKVKIEIGSLYPNDSSNTEVSGVDATTKLTKQVVVESMELYSVLEHYYSMIADAIKSVISSCPPNIVEDITNYGVSILGGASLITGAEPYFRKKLDIPVKIEDYTTAIDVLGAGKLLTDIKLQKELARV